MIFTLLLALGALLAMATWSDLRTRTISNKVNLAVALLAPAWWFAIRMPLWPDVAIQIALAIGIFIAFAGLFALGAMGGGDVKLIAAVALWLRPQTMLTMLVVMALLGGVLTIVMLVRHGMARREGQPEIPYGVAIAAATALIITNEIFTSSST